jgi:hypothetical protein
MLETNFVVRGFVDGLPSTARWHDGALDADPELIRRAQIVVALGETFCRDDEPGNVVHADLKGGVATALTIMRAFSRVTSVELARREAPRHEGTAPESGSVE